MRSPIWRIKSSPILVTTTAVLVSTLFAGFAQSASAGGGLRVQSPLRVQTVEMQRVNDRVMLATSGGSGSGRVIFSLQDRRPECRLIGRALTSRVAATCAVYATKLGDRNFLLARSETIYIAFRQQQVPLTLDLPTAVIRGEMVSATVQGGSGSGAVRLVIVEDKAGCIVQGLQVSATTEGSCTIVARKDSDEEFASTTSSTAIIDTRPPYVRPPSNPRFWGWIGDQRAFPGLKLTASFAGWYADNMPEAFAYQWFRGEAEIPGATQRTYVVTEQDCGFRLRTRITAFHHLFAPSVQYTPATSSVEQFLSVGTPSILGTPTAGATVIAVPGQWTTGTTFSFQWFADGALIPGAVKRYYNVSTVDQGKNLQVLITGSKPGYRSQSRLTSSSWRATAEPVYASMSYLASRESAANEVPTLRISSSPGVDPAWLVREERSIRRGVGLFVGFRRPAAVDVIFATGADIAWTENLFAARGYVMKNSIRTWMERDGCNIGLSWMEGDVPVIFNCLGPNRDSAMYQQIAAHEYAHQVQNQYRATTSLTIPGWITEGSASFFGISSAVYNQGLDMSGIDTYLRSYASSQYSVDTALGLPYGTERLLTLLKNGDAAELTQILRWSSDYGLLYVHTQFLLGHLLTEWLVSTYGLDSMHAFYEKANIALSGLPNGLPLSERRGIAEQAFVSVYGVGWDGLIPAALPYLASRAHQLQGTY